MEFHFWTAVSVIAAALRRRVWIDERTFQWTPNFYIILVGPPGVVTKSTSMKIGHRLLRKVPGIHFGPHSMTWQGLLRDFTESTELVPTPASANLDPLSPNYERIPMSCLTCDVSELGTFLKPRDPELVDFLTDMWDSQIGAWKRTLAEKGTTIIENPWINVMGCTTPSWLRDNFTSNMIFGGLASRCIFVWGDRKRRLIAYPSQLVEDASYHQQTDDLTNDLRCIAKMAGQMTLTPEALEWGVRWYKDHWEDVPTHLISDRFSGYRARKQGHVHKLAMILSASQSDSLKITKDQLSTAVDIATGLEVDMVKVFDSIGASESIRHVDEVMTLVRGHKTIVRRDLWRLCMRNMDERQFKDALDAAVTAGYIYGAMIDGKPSFLPKFDKEPKLSDS